MVALALLVTAGAPPAAGAPSMPGAGKARLTVAERRAVAVNSLTAVDDPSLGLIVTATFRGDIERYLGQGNLAHGLLALVLSPASAGLLDTGGGFAAMRVPILTRTGGASASLSVRSTCTGTSMCTRRRRRASRATATG